MPAARDDYLMRLLQEAAAALKRFRERLADGDNADEVIRDADAAIAALLGPQRAMLDRLDAWSASNLLGDPQRLRSWCDLLLLKADACPDAPTAQRWRDRANGLAAHIKV
jgi:hypothetical protein